MRNNNKQQHKRVFFVDPMLISNPTRYDCGALCETDNDITFEKIIVHSSRKREEIERKFNASEKCFVVILHGIYKINCDKGLYDSQKAAYNAKYGLGGDSVVTSLGTQLRYEITNILAKIRSEMAELSGNASWRLVIEGKVKAGLSLRLTA